MHLVTDVVSRVDPGTMLLAGDGALEVTESRPHQHRFIVRFAGVDSREAAERLRGVLLRAQPVDEPGALWVHELIGCEVKDSGGVARGTVVSVEANPASDLLVLDDGHLVPVQFVVDFSPGRVVVDAPVGLFDL